MEVISTVALISINATLAAQVVSFLIFLFAINRLMFRPLRDVIGERNRRIDGIQQEVVAADQEMKKILATIENEETKVKHDAVAIQKALEREGNQSAEAALGVAAAEIERLKAQTSEEVKRQIADVRQHLAQESEKLSRIIMEKALDRSLSHE